MGYFNNFPVSRYFFGDELQSSLFQNITTTIDILDTVVNDTAFYEIYKILEGERPDTLSYKLYGSAEFYWTFFLLNEKLRIQGWPLTSEEIERYAKEYYPNEVITTSDAIYGEFNVGDIAVVPSEEALNDLSFDLDGNVITPLVFTNLRFKGRIIAKNYDLGQLIIKPLREIYKVDVTNPGSGYTSPPTITVKGGGGTGVVLSARLSTEPGLEDTVSEVFIVNAGDDFTSTPTLEFSLPDIEGGTQAQAVATISRYTADNDDQLYSIAGIEDPLDWDGSDENLRVTTAEESARQYNAAHHWEDTAGNRVDLDLTVNGGVYGAGLYVENLTKVTNKDNLFRQNDDLSTIKVLKPDVIQQVNVEFQKLLRRS